jgi:hypothetical protein
MVTATLAGLLLTAVPAAASGAFLTELEDLPLPPGLTELPGGTLFDSPGGRIVEATAEGEIGAQQVLTFYTQTLPQLGWEKVGSSTFRRDNELLRIDVEGNRRPLAVRFSLVPQ